MVGLQLESEPSTNVLARVDTRADEVRQLMEAATPEEIAGLWAQLDLSGIYHDCALEGQVISPDELTTAFDDTAVKDATALPVFTTLRTHKHAYDTIRELAGRKRLELNLDLFKQFHAMFASNPDEAKAGRYRKDIPLHRSYFHEINEPQKIGPNMRQLVAWINNPEEAANIIAFTRGLGLEFGEMDVLSDRTDGRIDIVDANNTPWGPPRIMAPADIQRAVERLSVHFKACYFPGDPLVG